MGHQYSNNVKHRAVLRELKLRKSVYAKRVAAGQMSPHMAAEEIAVFEAIAEDYAARAIEAGERLL
jgi:hypothetical protein